MIKSMYIVVHGEDTDPDPEFNDPQTVVDFATTNKQLADSYIEKENNSLYADAGDWTIEEVQFKPRPIKSAKTDQTFYLVSYFEFSVDPDIEPDQLHLDFITNDKNYAKSYVDQESKQNYADAGDFNFQPVPVINDPKLDIQAYLENYRCN